MQTHYLKTIEPYFTSVWNGFKKFEVRNNDRNFQVGDWAHLQEYDPELKTFSGREIRIEITYILKDYEALKEGYIVFAFDKIQHYFEKQNLAL